MSRHELRREREAWRRNEYRRLILKAAEQVIVRKGYSATTMDDVAREADFCKATLYHYFRGKEELLLELLGNFFEEIDLGLQKILTLRLSADEKLKRGIRFYIQFNQDKENISRMLMIDRSFMEKMQFFVGDERKLTSEWDRRFITKVKVKRRDILDGVAEILKEGVAAGEFRKMDVPATVTFLESLLQGYCHVRFWHDRPLSVNEATDLIHRIFLQGIENREGSVKGEPK